MREGFLEEAIVNSVSCRYCEVGPEREQEIV